MTREEEIINAAYDEAEIERQLKMHQQVFEQGFVAGAMWADRTMIEKACEWIHTAIYLDYERSIEHRYATLEELLKEFKKAMKGY